MSTGIIEIIKTAALEAVENSNPCDLRFGTVSSISPLKVKVSNDFIIPESLLIVPEHLTDHGLVTNLGGEGGDSGDGSSVTMKVVDEILTITTTAVVDESTETTEQVDFVDERTITMYNSLEVGDNVVLLRNQGGSSYLIIDRI
jgi:hypothetical protein